MDTSFEDFFKRLSPTLKKITYRLNGHFSFFDDDDLFQEATVYLWTLFQKKELDDKTDSYILQGCYFHLKNYIRRSMDKANLVSLNSILNDGGGIGLEEVLSSKTHPVLYDGEKMLVEEVVRENGLSQKEKKVLCLSLDGLTTRQIGKLLGLSHVSIVKIKKKIRAKCSDEAVGEV